MNPSNTEAVARLLIARSDHDNPLPTHIECINPILRVEYMAARVRYVVL